jgi:hypothetical protein
LGGKNLLFTLQSAETKTVMLRISLLTKGSMTDIALQGAAKILSRVTWPLSAISMFIF